MLEFCDFWLRVQWQSAMLLNNHSEIIVWLLQSLSLFVQMLNTNCGLIFACKNSQMLGELCSSGRAVLMNEQAHTITDLICGLMSVLNYSLVSRESFLIYMPKSLIVVLSIWTFCAIFLSTATLRYFTVCTEGMFFACSWNLFSGFLSSTEIDWSSLPFI